MRKRLPSIRINKILIIGGSGSAKKILFDLLCQPDKPDINKIYLNVKDPYEANIITN